MTHLTTEGCVIKHSIPFFKSFSAQLLSNTKLGFINTVCPSFMYCPSGFHRSVPKFSLSNPVFQNKLRIISYTLFFPSDIPPSLKGYSGYSVSGL